MLEPRDSLTPEQTARHVHRSQRTRRAPRLFSRVVLSALALVAALSLGYGVFEYIAWYGAVNSYTYVAYDTQGKVVAQHAVANAQSASALRQTINSESGVPFGTPYFTPGCTKSPDYNPSQAPFASYTYTFFAGGRQVETVMIDNASCGAGAISCGGITVIAANVLPYGVPRP